MGKWWRISKIQNRKRRSEFLNSLLFRSFTSHQEVHQRGILLQFFTVSIDNVQHLTVNCKQFEWTNGVTETVFFTEMEIIPAKLRTIHYTICYKCKAGCRINRVLVKELGGVIIWWSKLPLGVSKKIRLKSVNPIFASKQKKILIHW